MPNRRTWTCCLAAAVLAVLGAGVVIIAGHDEPRPGRPVAAPRTSAEPAARPAPKPAPARLVHKVETPDPVVFLTIDDGAVRDPAMIDVLRDAGIPATLFLTAEHAKADPAFFRRLRDETGSAIENHTVSHANLLGLPLDAQRAQIEPSADYLADEFGDRPTLFRAPYGNSDDATLAAAGEAGAKYVVHWGSTINDGVIDFAGPHEFRPGSIVLTHFRHSFAADVAAFRAQAAANGLTPALLTDYLR